MLRYGQIESLDRGAGFISNPLEGQAAPAEEREHRRSQRFACKPEAGPSEKICRTVTFFVERYHELGTLPPFILDRLPKRFFLILPPPAGENAGR